MGSRWLLDDVSEQGTVVAGQRLQRCVLVDGMDVKLGQWHALFRERGGSSAAGT